MSNSTKRLSFEFFPPKTPEGRERLQSTQQKLDNLKPDFYSVTYGAGGSTRETTLDVARDIQQSGARVAPHLSFGGQPQTQVEQLLDIYHAAGMQNLVALRGDLPSGMGGTSQLTHADTLVRLIREHSGNHFHIDVAAYPEVHPEASSYEDDVGFLKGKFDAGADSAITQYFYNVDGYFYFLDRCLDAGIEQPIYPGIMPILNFTTLTRFSRNCGAEIPRWITQRMEGYGDDQVSIRAFGTELVTQLCDTLISNGAPGLHFYTMNQVEPSAAICRALGLDQARSPKATLS